MSHETQETLFGAAAWELYLLYDEGKDLPVGLATACRDTLAELERGCDDPDLVQAVRSPTDDGRMSVMFCPGARLLDQMLSLRRHRTWH